ncbi:hypothetical protein LWC35_03260 [Pseudonocardia kujensis]|uniref:hypothetical protein n=1 Tax=Pseudonocardia kujensis TaxID=1128675 RepID=UPI001E4777E1|nr:hypothetical protein [Pseudonocardia kujensis]MCE0761935.1 hypothetical protein [Pseudonocardia kujensis]
MGAEPFDIEAALARYRGTYPAGAEGDRQFRDSLKTSVVETTDDSVLRNRLSTEEIDDFLAYTGWNLWDLLGKRSTEGENSLIPRQEYETVAFTQQWLRFPQFYERITEAVGGAEGVVELGRTARREPANKLNNTRAWVNVCSLMGRGLLVALRQLDAHDQLHELNTAIQFQRRIQHGTYGAGPGYVTGRNYEARVLDQSWIDRFAAEVESTEGRLQECKKFNAATELFGFLMMFDTRSSTNTSGPYPLPDGNVMLVRDHFLFEDLYPWSDVASSMPYCVTQVMVFDGAAGINYRISDIGTTFVDRGDYLDHMVGFSVYAREKWNTPAADLRLLTDAEAAEITAASRGGLTALYRRISRMSRRDRIMAGVLVYTREMMAPFARGAGVWDEFVGALQFDELHRGASAAYHPLTTGDANDLLPRAFILGEAFPPVGHRPTW